MSGGSMDYLYARVKEVTFRQTTVLRRAFLAHLSLVAEALRAIEWNDSGDGDDDEEKNIRACLAPGTELGQAIKDAMAARVELEMVLKDAEARR
jgi:hypothetical protein